MRIFGKMTYLLHISRCLSYHAPICRPHRLLHGSCKQWKKICSKCVCWQPTPSQLIELLPCQPTMIHVQLYSQRSSSVFTPHTNVDMLRKRISFSGTPSESEVAETAPNVVPVGIIMPEAKDGKQLKIVIVPLDLANQDIESLRNTLEALNQLRMHASEIDAFTNSMIEDLNKDEAALSANETPTAIEELAEDKRKVSFFEGYVQGVDSGFSEESADAVATNTTDTRKATGKDQSRSADSQNMRNDATSMAGDAATQAAELRQLANELPNMVTAHPDNAATYSANNKNSTSETRERTEPTSSLPATSPEADVTPMTPAPYNPSVPSAPNQKPASPITTPGSPPQTMPQTMPLGDPKESQISANAGQVDSEEVANVGPHVDQISIEVPDSLGQRLNDMAIASMHLSFEMDMTNVRDAILNGELAHKPEPTLGKDAMVFLETKVEADPDNTPQNTVPLRFNALIKGMVQIDADKLDPSHLSDEQLPEYNDTVTSIAASICSTALQRGFASEAQIVAEKQEQQQPLDQQEPHQQLQQSQQQPTTTTTQFVDLPVSTDESKDIVAPMNAGGQIATHAGRMELQSSQEMNRMKQQHNVPTMSAVAEPIIDDQAAVASPQLKDGCKYPIIKKKKKCPKKCPLIDDPCKEDKCKRPQPKKTEKKAESTTEITALAGKKDPCGKKGAGGKDAKKMDPCAKKGGKDGGKKDPCAKKGGKDAKKDPCKKGGKGGGGGGDKKKDPCAKFKKGGKGGDKKKDPCGKKGAGGKDKKKDPCAKKGAAGKDKKDPCGKKGAGGKDKKDPCAKKGAGGKDKKKDACAKKGAGGKDKKDPCEIFKKNAQAAKKGGDKKDACKKGGDKKDGKGGKGDKKDPCAKFKKGSGGKGDKKDPCKKKYSTYSSPVSKFYHPNGSHFRFTRYPKRFISSLPFNGSKTIAKKSTSTFLLKLRPCFKTYTTRVRRSQLKNQPNFSSCFLSKQSNISLNTPAKFQVYSTLVRRHYGGMPSATQMTAWGITSPSVRKQIQRGYSKKSKKKKKKENSKCNALQAKGVPRDRKHTKARTALRTDCYDPNSGECPVNRCTGKCDEIKMPRKKCERGQPKSKVPKRPKQPKKKLPAICMVGKKNKDKKDKGRKK